MTKNRFLKTGLIACVVWLIGLWAAGCGSGGGDGNGNSELSGYWVWVQEVEDGQVVLEVTDEDMEARVGPSGWPDCPAGILCTRYGIQKVAFGAGGRFHYGYNVHTSSDYQTLGTLSSGDGVASFSKEVRFSCAHPEQTNEDPAEGTFLYRFEGGRLWISVSRFSGFEIPFGKLPARSTTAVT
jgi:hypothetical protein